MHTVPAFLNSAKSSPSDARMPIRRLNHRILFPSLSSLFPYPISPTFAMPLILHPYFGALVINFMIIRPLITINVIPPAKIIAPAKPIVGRYISAPDFPADSAFSFNLRAMASATIRQHEFFQPDISLWRNHTCCWQNRS